MIKRIDADNGEPKVVGLALGLDLANGFPRDLAAAVKPLGWEVRPPRKTAEGLAADGGPWAFEIGFRPVAEPAAPKEPPKAPARGKPR